MTRKKYNILRRIREFDYSEFRRGFKEELITHLNTFNKDKILMRIDDTIESIILAIITANTVDRRIISLIYFPHGYKSRITRYLHRLSSYLDTTLITIDPSTIVSSLESYVKGLVNIAKGELYDDVIGLILRKYADEEGYFILGEYTRTSWMLGGFNEGYIKSVDYLPLSRVYYSQLRYIARELRSMPLIRKARNNSMIEKLLKRLKITDEVVDGVIYGIEHGYTDHEISVELDIDENAVFEIRRLVNDNYLRRNRPLAMY
ncbi:hypothetical protein DRN84_00870 [Candidatus Geothermarchaeota archaeon]|nr:MAG: hypothetical protein DRN84_00870 [Candidatus Geothermarchaeota archaeon]HEW93882.1 hypothetical protein [Thermoprotei archaeon]